MTALGPVERMAAGAVGEPGDRTFFLEVAAADGTHWFVLEKEQVAALAREALETLRRDGLDVDVPPAELSAPGEARFRIGELRVGYGSGTFHFALAAAGDEPEMVEFEADARVVAAMAVHALGVVAAGRPRCSRCGLPEDPSGHVCPASNGDLRRTRR